ncbi:MAG: hypothetical protein ABSA39_18255 [Edaphobacter sp.]
MALGQQFVAAFAAILSCLLFAGRCNAQATLLAAETSPPVMTGSTFGPVLDEGRADKTLSIDPQAQTTSPAPSTATNEDGHWHVAAVPYLWFPGMHGTIGALGHNVSVHVGATDILSHFRFGLAGITEFRRNHLVAPVDFMWVRLGEDKALPFPNVGAQSADIKMAELILTPEIGYRLINHEKYKIDAVTGFRYWHLAQSADFSPQTIDNFSISQNWVAPLVGARVQTALSPKVALNVFGDVGGWGAGSQLEYQVVGLLGYRLNPKWLLQVGYRYLDVNYRSGSTLMDIAMPGIMFGATIKLK